MKNLWKYLYYHPKIILIGEVLFMFCVLGFIGVVWHRTIILKTPFPVIEYILLFLMILFVLFYKNISHLKDRSKQKYKEAGLSEIAHLRDATIDVVRRQKTLISAMSTFIEMVDSNDSMLMWVKDEEDRYIFADLTFREKILSGVELANVLGHTDLELILGREEDPVSVLEKQNVEITPEVLPSLENLIITQDMKICITDILTRNFNEPCRFYEEIGSRFFAVWKKPIHVNGELVGTVGSAVDVTKNKKVILSKIERLIREGGAFKISNTGQYYIKNYSFQPIF